MLHGEGERQHHGEAVGHHQRQLVGVAGKARLPEAHGGAPAAHATTGPALAISRDAALHVARRLTFGPTPEEIEKAKKSQIPAHVIDKALDKAKGGGGEDYNTVRYEGFGPGGVSLIVEALTSCP